MHYTIRILFSTLFFLSFAAAAQTDKGYEYLKEKQYLEAARIFEVQLPDVEAKYGLAKTYFEKTATASEIARGLSLLQEISDTLSQLDNKTKNAVAKYGASKSGISKLNRQLQEKMMDKISAYNSILVLDTFLEAEFDILPDLQPKVEDIRMDLVRHAAQYAKDYYTLKSLADNHYIHLSKLRYKDSQQVRRGLFGAFLDDFGLGKLDQFTDENENHPYTLDCWSAELNDAFEVDQPAAYLDFLINYPMSTLDFYATSRLQFHVKYYFDEEALTAAQKAQLQLEKKAWALETEMKYGGAFETQTQEEALDYIKTIAPSYRAYSFMQRTLQHYLTYKQWDPALHLLRTSKPLFPDFQPDSCETKFYFYSSKQQWFKDILPIIKRPDEGLNKVNVVEVNTEKGDEYSPVISADGSKMYFVGSGRPDNIGSDDIFVSDFDFETETWSEPKLVVELSTKEGAESPLSITADGNEILLFKDGKLHVSVLEKNGWSKPEIMPEEVNAFNWIGRAAFSADGKVLIFAASDDFEGLEGEVNIDLYFSKRNRRGKWKKAKPLGPDINTFELERSPYLASDNKTLYFSSNGHKGMGDMDIYMTRRRDDSWENWTIPKNLGKETNTLEDDWGYNYSMGATNNRVYLSSDDLYTDMSDIYYTFLPSFAQPEKRIPVTGKLDKAISTDIIITDLTTGEVLDTVRTRPDGSFTLLGIPNTNIAYSVADPDIFPTSKTLNLNTSKDYIIEDAPLKVMRTSDLVGGKTAPLDHIYFDFAKATLQPQSYPELQRVYDFMKNSAWKIQIEGHTDNKGSDDYNQTLAYDRATAVQQYLFNKGIASNRITVKSYGASQPIDTNETEEGRAKNRRVEVRLMR